MRALAALLALFVVGTAAATVGVPAAVSTGPDAPRGDDADPPAVGTPAPDPGTNRSGPAVVAVHPNPVAYGDRGEYVVVTYPDGAGWTLSDGETTVRLPGGADRAVVTAAPAAVNASGRIVVAPDLQLANAGEVLRLRHGPDVVDEVAYEDAPEGEILRPGQGWRPVGATDFAPATTGPATVEAFVLPDAPDVPIDTVRAADDRVLVGGYTFRSWRLARALAAASERGATVRVLVDGGPVGGVTRREARVLDWLADQGVAVEVLDGPRERYAFHHAKYVVADDRALVLTENFVPAGTGGHDSRGWGAVVHDAETAATLAEVFRADTGWRDTRPWREFRVNRSFENGSVANGSYPSRLRPRRLRADRVSVVVAPDNAESAVLSVVRGAEESVLVQQVSVGGRQQPFLRVAVAAARRGVRVRVLLSSAWYVAEENRRLVEQLNALSEREGLPIEARLAEPRSRYGKIHAKGVVVDGDTAVVGSINWNNHSVRENREVALVLEGEQVGSYYARAFRADWRGGTRKLPLGVLLVLAPTIIGTIVAGCRVQFKRGKPIE